MNTSPKAKPDFHFLFSYAVIVLIFLFVDLLVFILAGKEASSVVAVLLAGMAVQTMKEFERFRFREVESVLEVPLTSFKVSKWLVLSFMFMGITLPGGAIIRGLTSIFAIEGWFESFLSVTMMIACYLLGGYLGGKVALTKGYYTILAAACSDLIITHFIWLAVPRFLADSSKTFSFIDWWGLTWFLYLAATALGVQIGQRIQSLEDDSIQAISS